jgi:cobyrinic acid a,c-diamide synthase
VRGHEFHRTVCTGGPDAQPAWQWSTDGPDGFVSANRLASYLHLHWAGMPQMATRFVGAAA